MSFYKGHAGDSEHLVVPLFVREDILLLFDLLWSYPMISEPGTAPASSLVISVTSVWHSCSKVRMEGCFLFLFLTSQKGRCTWSPLSWFVWMGLSSSCPHSCIDSELYAGLSRGKWAPESEPIPAWWPFCTQTWSLCEEDSSGHKTCVVRKPEVSSIYCNELSTRPASGGAGPEEFLSLVALSCIFLFTLKITTGLLLILLLFCLLEKGSK